MDQLLADSRSLLASLANNALHNVFFPQAPFLTTIGHRSLKLTILLLVQLSYFHAILAVFPALKKDRKRLSWILTSISTPVISILWLVSVFTICRIVWQDPVPYELYNRADPVTSVFYRRYDIPFRPPALYIGNPLVLSPAQEYGPQWNARCLEQIIPCQCTLQEYERDMRDFYRQVDSTFYASVSSSTRDYPAWSYARVFGWFRLPPRLFFDTTFSPGTTVFAEWTILFFASYLSMDLVLGMIYYRDKLTLLSGYFHHTFHLFVCHVAIRTETVVPCVLLFYAEIPTTVLSLGFMFPHLRHDDLFGLTFVLSRFVMDALMTHELLRNTSMAPLCKFLIASKVPVNIKFFIDWIKQQRRLRRRQGQQREEPKTLKEKAPLSVSSGSIQEVSSLSNI
ncbi:MAG: hypothetical protein BYD32DRAFT_265138 [Podila humilis]|nr:MAG: hypothetical protein BYD32DRAFT_265138 [Podila humilis]